MFLNNGELAKDFGEWEVDTAVLISITCTFTQDENIEVALKGFLSQKANLRLVAIVKKDVLKNPTSYYADEWHANYSNVRECYSDIEKRGSLYIERRTVKVTSEAGPRSNYVN